MNRFSPLITIALTPPLMVACASRANAPERSVATVHSSSEAKPRPLYPPTRVGTVEETHFGVTTIDRYRWMESGGPEFTTWLDAQNVFARSVLDATPTRASLAARIEELRGGLDAVSSVKHIGDGFFFLRRSAGAGAFSLWRRSIDTGADEKLLDPEVTGKGTRSIDFYAPAPDQSLIAYGIAENGSETAVLRIFDPKKNENLPEIGPRVRFASVGWVSNNEFLYTDYLVDRSDKSNGRAIYLHRIGTPYANDVAVFGPKLSPAPWVDDPLPRIVVDLNSEFVLAKVSRGVLDPYAVFAKKKTALRSTKEPWRVVATVEDAVDSAVLHGGDVWLLTHKNAPKRKVARVRLNAKAKEVTAAISESKVVIQDIFAAKDALYLLDLDGGLARVRRFDWSGSPSLLPPLPLAGESDLASARSDSDGVLIRMESVTTPEQWYRFDPGTLAWSALTLGKEPSFTLSNLTSRRLLARSKDGTELPVEVYHRTDVPLDGKNPTLLCVYGSYGLPNVAGFSSSRLAWLERGGVIAYAHVRGGGEYGEGWHQAGMKRQKQNAVDDYIATAEALFAAGYTTPAHLGGQAQSAGAIVLSMAILQRPDAFGAGIFGSGMLQALRSEFAEGGVANTAEFGTVQNQDDFQGLYAMDALQHVRTDAPYPPMLFSVGTHDPRVPAWDSAKVVAELQAKAHARGHVLLRVDFHDGHGVGSAASSQVARVADYYAFAFDALGRERGSK